MNPPNEHENRLATAPMLPLILKMALPSVAAQLVNLLYSIVDRIYIGHIPGIGTEALAGVGVTGSIILMISAFSQIVGGGGAPLAAIALGNGDRDRAGRILGNGFVLLLCSTALTTTVTAWFMRPLLLLIGASPNTIGYATDYLSIYLMGTLFVQLATGLNSFINSQGRPTIAMCSVLIGAFINIVLDPVFIFGFGWGVRGAALATVISQFCSAAWVLRFLCSSEASLRLELRFLRPDPKVLRSILSLGISPFVMSSTESLMGFVLNGSLSVYGDIYVSALTVMQSAMQMISVPLSGFAQGAVPVLSYNYGHRSADRVRQGVRIVMSVMVPVNLALTLLMILFPGQVASLFTKDPELIAVVSEIMPLFMAGMTIFGLQRACQNTFVSLGQAGVSLFIAVLRKLILLIPLALLLPHCFGLGVYGVYAAEAVADAT
ncbi:MAG: MATE family efflux transporter, partial [Gemmiger sp.]